MSKMQHQDSGDVEKKEGLYDAEVAPIAKVTEVHDLFEDDAVDPVYRAKSQVLNRALQEMGMGKYQVSCTSAAIEVEYPTVGTVVVIRRRGIRLVCVRISYCLHSLLLTFASHFIAIAFGL